ncbi:MAG: OmpA family protein [Elusimicrobiota bacterium]|nr:OmpA family protein [Elusimicrobiota bacterium]
MANKIFLIIAATLCLCNLRGEAFTDIPGSQDHPMLSRYPNSVILKYKQTAFDRLTVASGPERKGSSDIPAGESLWPTQTLEGKVTRIIYKGPDGRSALEIERNYQNALLKAGFSAVTQIELKGPKFSQTFYKGENMVWLRYKEIGFYSLWRHERGTSVVVFVVPDPIDKKATPVGVSVDVIEARKMENDLVRVSANELAQKIEDTGHAAVYGIFFDTNSANLKSESRQNLSEIGKLLKSKLNLNLYIVGHTDSTGNFEANLQLSKNRAVAVIAALVKDYAIAGNRLTPYGVGPLSPVGSNKSEQGRSKNRRVELIER